MHHFFRVIRRRLFFHCDSVAEFSSEANGRLDADRCYESEKGYRQVTARNFTSARLPGLSWRPFAIARGSRRRLPGRTFLGTRLRDSERDRPD
jgi:hypothetical protein